MPDEQRSSMTASPSPTARIAAGSILLDLPSTDWQPTSTPGMETKTIFQDPKTGESTILMRMEPGSSSPKHSHTQLEEIYVLEGEFSDQDHRYTAGQYCLRAIGAEHETRSENGGIVLLIYRN